MLPSSYYSSKKITLIWCFLMFFAVPAHTKVCEGPLFLGQRFNVGDGPSSVASGDLDGDGDLDIVLANYDSNDISILFNNNDWVFEPDQRLGVGSAQ